MLFIPATWYSMASIRSLISIPAAAWTGTSRHRNLCCRWPARIRRSSPATVPLASKADVEAARDMLVDARDRVRKLLKAGKTEAGHPGRQPAGRLRCRLELGLYQHRTYDPHTGARSERGGTAGVSRASRVRTRPELKGLERPPRWAERAAADLAISGPGAWQIP